MMATGDGRRATGDGLEYKPNWVNRTIWTKDNLHVLRGLNSACVDLIYLDPPFNSNRTYEAPIGSEAAGAAFKDAWTFNDADRVYLALLKERDSTMFAVIEAARLAHGKGMAAYLGMMAQRLLEMRRVLKPTGSIYLHCDPTASHYLKMLMDAIFGTSNFRNEIVWCYTGPSNTKRWFPRKHDIILWYSMGNEWTFNRESIRVPYVKLETGKTSGIFKQAATLDPAGKVPEDWWQRFSPAGRIKRERTGYPTQKPLALLDRIIKTSSNEGDIVLDPFCGCATAAVAAERLQRQWIGIDISEKARELVQTRLTGILDEVPLYKDGDVVLRADQPKRTDLGKLPGYASHRNEMFGRQDGHCGGCRVKFPKRNLTVDHIVPRKHGGTDHIENLWLLCGACNSSKGTRSQEDFLKERMQKRVELFPWLVD